MNMRVILIASKIVWRNIPVSSQKGTKNASSHYEDPYAFVESIAGAYAPGSTSYVSDNSDLITRYALYNSIHVYWPEIKEAKENLKRAKDLYDQTEIEYEMYCDEKAENINNFGLLHDTGWLKECFGDLLGADDLLDEKDREYQHQLDIIAENIVARKQDLKSARKAAHSTVHTLAIGLNRGRFDGYDLKKLFGKMYSEIMREYKKL